jgi:hypothetical protein
MTPIKEPDVFGESSVDGAKSAANLNSSLSEFIAEAILADVEMDVGVFYLAQDVHHWLEQLIKGEISARPTPCHR